MMALATTMLALSMALAAPAASGGKLPYRLGMSRDAVRAEPACTPYVEVPSTGGLECANFTLDRRRNISFVFDAGGLAKIVLWFAEAAAHADAMRATDELLAYMGPAYGALESHNLPAGARVTTTALFAVLDGPKGPEKVQLRPQQAPQEGFVFASIMRNERYGYYVFLYLTRPPK